MRLKLIGAIGVAIVVAALSATSASAANTITIGTVTLTNRVLLQVPVTFVCDPQPDAVNDSVVVVFVRQASGQQVASGESVFEPIPTSFTCDGVTQNHLVVGVFPDQGSPRFRGGGAVASAEFGIHFSSGADDSGGTGFIPIKIRG